MREYSGVVGSRCEAIHLQARQSCFSAPRTDPSSRVRLVWLAGSTHGKDSAHYRVCDRDLGQLESDGSFLENCTILFRLKVEGQPVCDGQGKLDKAQEGGQTIGQCVVG